MNLARRLDEVAPYLLNASHAPTLEREEELELTRRWKYHQDRDAADRLARGHMRVVVATAHKYRRYGVPLGELVAEGNFGVAHALSKFDPERGLRFVTYSIYWIRAFMLDHIIRSWSMVGGGAGPLRSRVFFKLRRERVRITNMLGAGEAADRALAERIGVKPEVLRRMVQRLDSRDVSLELTVSTESKVRLVDCLPGTDNQEQGLLDQQVGSSMRGAVGLALAELDPRERYIAEHRLMADHAEELSLAEIGRVLGVSRERARQLEARTKTKLRARIPALGDAVVNEWLTHFEAERALAGNSEAGVVDGERRAVRDRRYRAAHAT